MVSADFTCGLLHALLIWPDLSLNATGVTLELDQRATNRLSGDLLHCIEDLGLGGGTEIRHFGRLAVGIPERTLT